MSNSSQLNVLNNDFTLTITDEAAKRVRDVVNGGLPETAGLRVGVVGGAARRYDPRNQQYPCLRQRVQRAVPQWDDR